MKKMKRFVAVGVLVLALALGTGFVWIDRIAKAAVEAAATYALGVRTTLHSMDIGVTTGNVSLAKLHIANPEGFDTPHFMDLGSGSVAVSLGSLMDKTVTFPELKLGALDMNLERKGTTANYKAILDELKKFESKESAVAPGDGKPQPRSDSRTFIVKLVTIEGVKVNVNVLPLGGKLTRVPIVLPRIELRDVGAGPGGGVEMGKLIGIVMRAVLDAVVREGGGLIPGDVAGELRAGIDSLQGLGGITAHVVGDVTTVVDGQVRKLGELSADTLKKLGSGAGDLGEGVKDAGKKIGEGLGDLLKKKEEKPEEKKP